MKKPEDSNLLKGNGQMTNESTSRADFNAKKGDRFDVKKPGTSELWEVS